MLLTTVVLGAGLFTLASASSAEAKVTATLGTDVVTQGQPVRVRANLTSTHVSKKCIYKVTASTTNKRHVYKSPVRRGRSLLRIGTAKLAPDNYRVSVSCGKADKARALWFTVLSRQQGVPEQTPDPAPPPSNVQPVPSPTPTQPPATPCQVAESGWRYRSSNGYATAGVRVKNDSSTWDATGVLVTVNFWSGNVIVKTDDKYLERIPAGQSLLAGFDVVTVAQPVTRMSAFVTCESEPLGAVRQVISGSASAVPSVLGGLEIRGQFTNTYPFALSGLARIDYVSRGPDGAINGGGMDFPSGPVPAGVTTGWQAWNPAFSDDEVLTSIEFTVEPEAD